tara:strand:+ start:214 stop:483 length:270 start_codon:yes stop_codon:yes gene_type:complete
LQNTISLSQLCYNESSGPLGAYDLEVITKDYVIKQIEEFFEGDFKLMDEWLNTPLPILSHCRPADYLSSEEKRVRLLGVIGEMRHGEMA